MPIRPHACAAIAIAMLAASGVSRAEPGDMMHMNISSKVQVGGMAINAPAISHDACVPRDRDPGKFVNRKSSHGGNCTVSDVKRVGDSWTMHYACTGDMTFQGDGKFSAGGAGMKGEIHATGNVHGQPLTVDISYAGTPTGATCEANVHVESSSSGK